jgi:hypothetical protein
MIESNFNPYDVLCELVTHCERNHKNTMELAAAHNKQARALEELAKQHQDLVELFSKTRMEIIDLRTQLELAEIKRR